MGDIYTLETYDPRVNVGSLINRARIELGNALDKELARFDMTAAQYVVVSMLAAGYIDTAAQMCRENSYDPGAMTRMVDRLEKKGFLHRVRSTEDRRIVRLELTEQGKAILPELRACTLAVMNRLLRNFTKSEVRQFENFLEKMVTAT